MVNRGIAILIKPRIRLCIAFLVHRQELHHAIGTLAHGSNKRSKWSSSNRGWESIFEYFFRYSGGMEIPVYWLVTGPWPHRCYLKRFVKSKPSCPETQVPNSSDWSQLKFPIDVQTPPVWKKNAVSGSWVQIVHSKNYRRSSILVILFQVDKPYVLLVPPCIYLS